MIVFVGMIVALWVWQNGKQLIMRYIYLNAQYDNTLFSFT